MKTKSLSINLKKSLRVAKKFGIKVVLCKYIKSDFQDYEVRGRWNAGKTILINPKIATNYTVLHEIGHVLNGDMCCREHCEYVAHGCAIGLAKAFNIRLHPTAKKECDVYAGFGVRKNCGILRKNDTLPLDKKEKS